MCYTLDKIVWIKKKNKQTEKSTDFWQEKKFNLKKYSYIKFLMLLWMMESEHQIILIKQNVLCFLLANLLLSAKF